MNIIRANYGKGEAISCDECGKNCFVTYELLGAYAKQQGNKNFSIILCFRCLRKLTRQIGEAVEKFVELPMAEKVKPELLVSV